MVRRLIDIQATRLSTVVNIGLCLAALGCGRTDSADRPSAQPFRVALLTPGPVSDQAWNSGAYAGLTRIRDSLGAQISHIQTKTPADIEENFRQYGSQKYDLVFGHGFEFQDPATRIAPDYPATVYVTTSGNRMGTNVAPLVFGFEEAAYLAGIVAGSLTRSNVIAAVGGTELPPVKSGFLAYEAGAKSVNPNVRIVTSYIGNWDDASAGKEQAVALIGRGADFIFQNADAAGLGVFQAAKERKGVYVFGANSNQNALAPDVVIASAVIDLPLAFLTVARQVKEGRFKPHILYLGADSHVVRLEMNPALAPLVTPRLRTVIDSVQRRISAGTLKPPRLDFIDTTTAH